MADTRVVSYQVYASSIGMATMSLQFAFFNVGTYFTEGTKAFVAFTFE